MGAFVKRIRVEMVSLVTALERDTGKQVEGLHFSHQKHWSWISSFTQKKQILPIKDQICRLENYPSLFFKL